MYSFFEFGNWLCYSEYAYIGLIGFIAGVLFCGVVIFLLL